MESRFFMYRYFIKYILDFFFATLGLVVTSPILFISIVLISISSKGPVFFLQDRVGKKGSLFKVIKLRTMTHKKRETVKQTLAGDAEITKIGHYLRRFKIDELPQLINILKGDMSIVGPRPAMPSILEKLNEDGLFRLEVRPGLTGLAQVNGNIYLDWKGRWKYNKRYVENLS